MTVQSTDSSVALRERRWRQVAGTIGALGVAAGAFGAHALQTHPRIDVWKTAALYQMFHAVVLVVPAIPVATRVLFTAGVVVFSGSLYALVLLDEPWLGAITPIGGVSFIAGWLWLGWSKS